MSETAAKIRRARTALKQIGYHAEKVTAKEFSNYMTGETFSEDSTTLADVLDNEYLVLHELAEISELKKTRRTIDRRVIIDSPKTVVYEAHLKAMELELEYALLKKDYLWVKIRLKQFKESVLNDDPNLPATMRPRAEAIYVKFKELARASRS